MPQTYYSYQGGKVIQHQSWSSDESHLVNNIEIHCYEHVHHVLKCNFSATFQKLGSLGEEAAMWPSGSTKKAGAYRILVRSSHCSELPLLFVICRVSVFQDQRMNFIYKAI